MSADWTRAAIRKRRLVGQTNSWSNANQPWVICSCWQLQLPWTSGEKQDERTELTRWETPRFSPDLKKKYSRVSPLGSCTCCGRGFSLLLPLFIFNEPSVDCSRASLHSPTPAFYYCSPNKTVKNNGKCELFLIMYAPSWGEVSRCVGQVFSKFCIQNISHSPARWTEITALCSEIFIFCLRCLFLALMQVFVFGGRDRWREKRAWQRKEAGGKCLFFYGEGLHIICIATSFNAFFGAAEPICVLQWLAPRGETCSPNVNSQRLRMK